MFEHLLKFLAEQHGVPTKKIINDDEWMDFDFNLGKRDFHKETEHTPQTKGGQKKHLEVHKKIGKQVNGY